jgi:hypothetical protein
MVVPDGVAALRRVLWDAQLAAEVLPDLRPFPDGAEILRALRLLDADHDAVPQGD